MSEYPLQFPLDGLNDDQPKSKQPPLTTTRSINCRSTEPGTGRERGGTREPVSRVTTQNTGAPVREIQVAQFDNSGLVYTQAAQGAQTYPWSVSTPLIRDCPTLDIDIQRNRIAIDGLAGVVAYNDTGQIMWKFVLPVKSQEHVVRALVVDGTGAFYVAVSSGYPQNKGRLWKFRPNDAGQGVPNLEWEVEINGYIERLRLRNGVLFAAVNYPDRGKSAIVAYRLIDTAVPEVAWTRDQVPYPINDLTIRAKDGAIFTAHEPNANRATDPRSPDTTKIAVDWTIDRLAAFDQRGWCILDASDIDGDGSLNSAYVTGDPASLVVDQTGNQRNAYSCLSIYGSQPVNSSDPTLNKSKTLAGQDTILFSNAGAAIGAAHNFLVTPGNASTSPTVANAQRTLIPCYDNAWFTVVAVLRVSDFTHARAFLGQLYPATKYRSICINTDTTGGSGITNTSGKAAFVEANGANAGPYASYDAVTGFCVVAFSCTSDGTAVPTGLNVVDGTACTNQTFTGRAISTTLGTQLGKFTTTILGASLVFDGTAGLPTELPFDGELAYFAAIRDYSPGGVKTLLSTAEFNQIVGMLHWRFGIAHLLPGGHPYALQPPTADPLPGGTDSAYLKLTDTHAELVKWDPNGAKPRWIASDMAAVGVGGIGYAVEVPPTDLTSIVFSMGPVGTGTAGTATLQRTRDSHVRRIVDNGDSFALTGANTWESKWTSQPDYHNPKCAVSAVAMNEDTFAGTFGGYFFFVPVHVGTDALYIYSAAGSANAGTNTDTPPARTIGLTGGARGLCCAVEKIRREYSPALLVSTIDEFVTIGTPHEGSNNFTLVNVQLVNVTRTNTAPRSTYVVAASGTNLLHVSGVSVPGTSGSPALANNDYVSIIATLGRLWIADGLTYQVLDPRAADGIGRVWRSKTAGGLPKNGRLLCPWLDRIAVARGEDPLSIFFTATADPYNCDLFPFESNGGEACEIPVGDVVNCLIPLSKDHLICGTQTGAWLFNGNPARGGSKDRLGDINGLAFGEPWCKDPEGRVFAFEARGGVVELPSGSSISSRQIRRRLESIDFSLFYVRLVWNWRAMGLHVFLIPRSGTGTTTTAFFWERDRGRWWQDLLPFCVTSARLVDGDALTQRAVWMGCSDGLIRRFDETATTDDGSPLIWSVVGGPMNATMRMQRHWMTDERSAIRMSRPRFTLAGESSGCRVALYASEGAEIPAIFNADGSVDSGLSDAVPIQVKGSNVWWELRGSGPMAFEGGSCLIEPMGIRRLIS